MFNVPYMGHLFCDVLFMWCATIIDASRTRHHFWCPTCGAPCKFTGSIIQSGRVEHSKCTAWTFFLYEKNGKILAQLKI